MPPAARITDMHTRLPGNRGVVPYVDCPVFQDEPTVMIGGMPGARIGDNTGSAAPSSRGNPSP